MNHAAVAETSSPANQFTDVVTALRTGLASVISGHPALIDTTIAILLAQGHILIEDVPGVGKTTLAKALGALIDTKVGRIQFTPDLLPSDVTGVSIIHDAHSSPTFRPGPVFANIVIADEINRASPKAQSALLECMAERQVTVDGHTYALPDPFLVVATQNPIDMDGTYPLPEAQRDRFMARLDVGYPSAQAELQMLELREHRDPLQELRPVTTAGTISALARHATQTYIAPSLKNYLVTLVAATRAHPLVRVGASPRATLQLASAARALAATRARTFVLPDDIQQLAVDVLAHRLVMTPQSRSEGVSARDVIGQVLQSIPVPKPDRT